MKNNGKQLLVFSPQTSGKGLSVSCFHTIKVLKSVLGKGRNVVGRRCQLLHFSLEGGKAWKSLCGDKNSLLTPCFFVFFLSMCTSYFLESSSAAFTVKFFLCCIVERLFFVLLSQV